MSPNSCSFLHTVNGDAHPTPARMKTLPGRQESAQEAVCKPSGGLWSPSEPSFLSLSASGWGGMWWEMESNGSTILGKTVAMPPYQSH